MILIISTLLFLSLFFFGLYGCDLARRKEVRLRQRIASRLRGGESGRSAKIQLERKERLSDISLFDRLLRTFARVRRFQFWLKQSGLPFSAGVFLLLSMLLAALAYLAAALAHAPVLFAVPPAAGMAALPFGYAALRRAKRMKQFNCAFPDAISRMASSLRAGFSLQMAFETVVRDGNGVLADDFRHVLAEIEVGQTFEEALKKILERVDTPELRLFIASVILQRESGGNLAELLDNLETTIRERFELQNELNAATSQARLSGLILGFLPVFVGVFVFMVNRGYILILFEDPVGKRLLWLSAFGQLMGFLAIRKIVNIRM